MITWNSNTKEMFVYGLAAISLIFGFGLTIAGFCVPPPGIVSDSVLWILGQCFVFAGAICGVYISVDNSKKKVQAELIKELHKITGTTISEEHKEDIETEIKTNVNDFLSDMQSPNKGSGFLNDKDITKE
jgi:hypothetical protein